MSGPADQHGTRMDKNALILRPLPSNNLEGAFRVHVPADCLEKAGLSVGDICFITSEDGTTGHGIAWRATEGMGSRANSKAAAKMTETMKNTFGFKEVSRVALEKTDTRITRAKKIVVTASDALEDSQVVEDSDGRWKSQVIGLLANCEALAKGISFDVNSKKKNARHLRIESVEFEDRSLSSTSALFFFGDRTELVFHDTLGKDTHVSSPASNGAVPRHVSNSRSLSKNFELDISRIGGLVEQCETLNLHLQCLLERTKVCAPQGKLDFNPALLIHGFEGTGKTLLLDTLAESGFGKVHWLHRDALKGGSVIKNQAIIEEIFDKAVADQPSMVLIDDLQQLVPSDDIAYGTILARKIKDALKIEHSQVAVVAATRSLSDVKNVLICRECFSYTVELSIPDITAREQILDILQGISPSGKDGLSSQIAARTHGFTGKDVSNVYGWAESLARLRAQKQRRKAKSNSIMPATMGQDVNAGQNSTADSNESIEMVSPGDSDEDILLRDFEAALKVVRPAALREVFTEKPHVRWIDIGGSGQIKERFDRLIGCQLHEKEWLQEIGFAPPKGVLLYGPPGCSKTLTAQAVANMYDLNFIAIKGAELISMYVGESERQVREVFRKAKAAAPCVIFFDEIDSIGSDRDSVGNKGLHVVTTLLNEMDGFEPLKDVFILAATNKPESLDAALMRPGRFDQHIFLGLPDENARREIIAIATKNSRLSGDVDLAWLVDKTVGYSGAEIVSVCHSAKDSLIERSMKSSTRGREIVKADFEKALTRTRKGITEEMLEGYAAFEARDKS